MVSKWVSNVFQRWGKIVYEYVGIDAMGSTALSSNHSTDARCVRKNALPWPRRCFDFDCASTPAALLLLGRWACLTQQAGGFHMASYRQAAGELFSSLLKIVGEEECKFPIVVTQDWKCKWPRPHATACFHTLSEGMEQGGGLGVRPGMERLWHVVTPYM